MRKTAIPIELRPVLLAANISTVPLAVTEENLDNISLLVIGSHEDGASQYLYELAQSMGIKTAFIPLETLLESTLLFWLQSPLKHATYPAIYYRSAGTSQRDLAQSIAVLEMLLPTYPGAVIHRTTKGSRNISKPWQASLMQKAGPEVKVIPTQLLRCVKPNQHINQIAKSISCERSQVVAADDLRLIQDDVLAAPTQYQMRLYGVNIRVHVCGDVAVAIRINTDALDYRYLDEDNRSLEIVTLPPDISAWCCRVTKMENLEFSGVDLYKDKNNQYWCFEVNPMPGYHFYEQQLNTNDPTTPISFAILNYLGVLPN